MPAVVIYESLTGNTRRAAEIIGLELQRQGVAATVCNITAIDLQALSAADLVVVGSWTDGMFFFGQRPGRGGRIKDRLPAMRGKRAVTFVTFALEPRKALDKLERHRAGHRRGRHRRHGHPPGRRGGRREGPGRPPARRRRRRRARRAREPADAPVLTVHGRPNVDTECRSCATERRRAAGVRRRRRCRCGPASRAS